MLDNLRDQASSSPFFEKEEPVVEKVIEEPARKKTIDEITQMNAKQRFILAVMLLMIVCLMGVMVLLVTGRFVLPFG
jgi:hypothetical protein